MLQGVRRQGEELVTFNELRVAAALVYDNGFHVPGRCSKWPTGGDSKTEPYIVTHNIILARAAAMQRYSEKYQPHQKRRIGILLDFVWYEPQSDSNADQAATPHILTLMPSIMLTIEQLHLILVKDVLRHRYN